MGTSGLNGWSGAGIGEFGPQILLQLSLQISWLGCPLIRVFQPVQSEAIAQLSPLLFGS
jgi:hypothetical protein